MIYLAAVDFNPHLPLQGFKGSGACTHSSSSCSTVSVLDLVLDRRTMHMSAL